VSSIQIPLVDLRAQYLSLKPEIMAAIEEVLEGAQLFLGPHQHAFESEFAAFTGCRYGVGVSSGTDALALALRACEIGPGDEVITVANTFIATVEAIALVGARPVFVDVDPETYLLDWHQIEQIVTPKTRAILPVHLYGHPVEMRPLLEFARKHNLSVIEDASQAHGAIYEGRPVGSLGDIACFSLYYSKNLGAFGEAGICTSSNAALVERIRMLRDHGSRKRYQHEIMGANARMDELQAAILRLKLPQLERWNALRQEHARFYGEQLQEWAVGRPVVCDWATHAYCYYVIRVQERDQFRSAMEEAGIATGIHYPIPVHLQKACEQYGYGRGSLPVTEALAEQIVSLPMYPELTEAQLQQVVEAVKQSVVTRVPQR
jgi:dTDP-4-amino-4,6-dideoxygalactose transaminase